MEFVVLTVSTTNSFISCSNTCFIGQLFRGVSLLSPALLLS